MSKRNKTPCVSVCIYRGPKGWCTACGLTSQEFRQWRTMKPYNRNILLKKLQSRKAEMNK